MRLKQFGLPVIFTVRTLLLFCVATVGQDHYYSYSQDATLTWLSRKVNVLADKLEEKGVQVGQGSRAALLVAARSKQATRGEDTLMVSSHVQGDLSI